MLIDIKYAFRLLFKSPKFTAMTLGVLIGGLSISLFTFSFLYTTVYKPLPLPEGDTARSVSIFENGEFGRITDYEYLQIKDDLSVFSEFGVYNNRDIRVSVEQSGKNYRSSYVQQGFFEFSRVTPIIGRTIQSDDTEKGATPVALVSHHIWQSELGGSDDVLTKTMILNGQVTEIIGVMPQGYRFPNTSQIWVPLTEDLLSHNVKEQDYLYAYARIKKGVSTEQAESEIGQLVNQIYQQNVTLYDLPEMEKSAKLLTFQMAQTANQGGVVFAFLNGISWLILLLACINVGNLLLARSMERQKETAIRAALGATTRRLVSQLMWEGIIISTLGGLLAILLAGAALDYTEIALSSWITGGGSFWWNYGMDWQTFTMGIVFTIVTIILSAFIPAWRSANQDINTTLRDGTRGAQSKKAGKTSRVLITAQVFLVATLMLVGSISAYIAHSFVNLDIGDDYTNVFSARLAIPEQKYKEPIQQLNLIKTLKEQISQHPNVTGITTNNWMHPSKITLEGVDYASEVEKPLIDTIGVIGDTETIGINLVAGRQFSTIEQLGSRRNVLISQSMANRYWPGESALEKSFTMTIDEKDVRVFVVGVVTNRMNPSTLFGSIDSADEIYVSGQQFISAFQVLYYRVLPNTKNAEEIFYQAMFNTDRTIELTYAVEEAAKNRDKMRESMQLLSQVTFTTGVFALMLALVGIYGVTSHAVAQRTHEVGIRRAVGASDKSIVRLFLRQGAKQLIIGLGLALALFALLATGFHNFTEALFPVHIYYMQALVVVAGLTSIVMFAIYTPTKRAVKMEPSLALRYE